VVVGVINYWFQVLSDGYVVIDLWWLFLHGILKVSFLVLLVVIGRLARTVLGYLVGGSSAWLCLCASFLLLDGGSDEVLRRVMKRIWFHVGE
jgi:hypothetical protein